MEPNDTIKAAQTHFKSQRRLGRTITAKEVHAYSLANQPPEFVWRRLVAAVGQHVLTLKQAKALAGRLYAKLAGLTSAGYGEVMLALQAIDTENYSYMESTKKPKRVKKCGRPCFSCGGPCDDVRHHQGVHICAACNRTIDAINGAGA